jgi:two-component system nitrate/nitrite response regulator NarL
LSRNEIAREGLRRILTERACTIDATASDPAALALRGHVEGPNVILVVDTDAGDGVDMCRKVRERLPDARILLMAEEYNLETVVRAFEEGVDGYLLQTICCDGLASAIELLSLGEKILPSQMAGALAALRARPPSLEWDANRAGVNLSSREVDILRCLVAGEANKLISRHLGITEATVKVHVKAILRKLNVANRTQAAIWAVVGGLSHDEGHGERPVEAVDDGTLALLPMRHGPGSMQQSAFAFTRPNA